MPPSALLPEPLVVRVTTALCSTLSFTHDKTELVAAELPLVGTTRWTASLAGEQVFLSWRWALVAFDVICVENPLEIQSNIYVIGENPALRRRRLITMISELPWQQQLLDQFKAGDADQSDSALGR